MTDLPKPPKRPCGTCPYRQDVPSGIWHRDEYEKLPKYDGYVQGQVMSGALGLFMCHQRDGCLCAGWLQCHDTDDLVALRLNAVDPSAFGYTSDVPVFESGQAAHDHGVREIDDVSPSARVKIDGLVRCRTTQN